MSRKLAAAVAQLGPIHLADDRASVVKRLLALLHEAHGRGDVGMAHDVVGRVHDDFLPVSFSHLMRAAVSVLTM